jgi:hypothetical protein
MNRLSVRIAVVASFLVLAPAIHHATAQSVKSIAGTYAIVSTESFGKGARGTLMLAPDGHYSLVVMRATLPKFASGSRTKGTPEEVKAIVDGSIAHLGRYTIDDGGKAITFHIETSTFPNWDGATQKRPLKLSGDLLTFTVAAPSGGGSSTDVVWKRVK